MCYYIIFNTMKIIIDKLYTIVKSNVYTYPSNTNVCINNYHSYSFSNLSVTIKSYINTLPIYTLSSLGLSNSNLNAQFTTLTTNNIFLVDLIDEKILCYSNNRKTITSTVWLKDYN